jgi:hypothetical protein
MSNGHNPGGSFPLSRWLTPSEPSHPQDNCTCCDPSDSTRTLIACTTSPAPLVDHEAHYGSQHDLNPDWLVPILSRKNWWILALNLPRTGPGLDSIRNHGKSFVPYPLQMFVILLMIWERHSPSMWISWSEGRAQCFSWIQIIQEMIVMTSESHKDDADTLLSMSQKRLRRMMTTTVEKRYFEKKS